MELQKQNRFKSLGFLTLLYAAFYTFCMYRNLAGITMPLWILSTILYACYALKRFEIQQKKDGIFHIIIMILLGISTVLTGNIYIIAMNYIGFFLLLLSFLLHTIYDDKEWGIATYLWKISSSIFGAIGELATPFSDGRAFQKLHPRKPNKNVFYIVIGFVMAIPSILFLTALLGSADAVFENYLVGSLRSLTLPTNLFEAIVLFAFAFLSGYCGLCYLLSKNPAEHSTIKNEHKLESLLAISFTAPITLLYVLFSLVQVFYLFLGFGNLPDGISYADYARTGFFQLLFVCFVNFVLVLFVQYYVKISRLLRGILVAICGCTFIMIASSAYRMILYIAAYQLTFLRIFVLVALTVISLLMAGVVCSLFQNHFPIYKYSLIVVSVIYLAFSFSHVDYFIADYNLSHAEESSLRDTLEYIATLSSDAAPAIADYMEQNKELKEKVASYNTMNLLERSLVDEDASWYFMYTRKIRHLSENRSIRRFNVSHYVASKVLDV